VIRSILLGLSAGMRSMTPVAVAGEAVRRGALPVTGRAGALLAHPAARAGLTLLAFGEALGDKMRSAPDRIVPPGIAARLATGALVGAAAAPRERQGLGALLGAGAAVGFAYLSFAARMRAMRRFGQGSTGLAEDALALGIAFLATEAGRGGRRFASRR
jgi:uncharacterized membrane protein